jgi:hypothetical protein
MPRRLKSSDDVTVLLLTVTESLPFVTPVGTVTVNCVVVAAEIVAGVPLNFTVLPDAFTLKLVPVMITCSPAPAAVGEKLVIEGAGGGGTGSGVSVLLHPILNKVRNKTKT